MRAQRRHCRRLAGATSLATLVLLAFDLALEPTHGSGFAGLELGISSAAAQTVPDGACELDDPLLAPTVDADCRDPFVVEKAAHLGWDAAAIFAFVRDEIGFESYVGSLRGARGTLWSRAGNGLDKSSLLVALLRASGFRAEYVSGTLSAERSRTLIGAMFPFVQQVVGCPPDGIDRADPAGDPQLLAEVADHYWVELERNGSRVSADPSFPDAQLGESFAEPGSRFDAVDPSQRHTVSLVLRAEVVGSALSSTQRRWQEVLRHTFESARLVGRPMTLGHHVTSTRSGATIVHGYSPYLLLPDDVGEATSSPLIIGSTYQEIYSALFTPLVSTVLTGLALEITVIDPSGRSKIYEQPVLDRIGHATRVNGGTAGFDDLDPTQPALSDLDTLTINVLAADQDLSSVAAAHPRLEVIRDELTAILPSIPAGGPSNPAEQRLAAKASSLGREAAILTGRTATMAFAAASDVARRQLEQGFLVRGYLDSPRVILVQTSPSPSGTMTVAMDLERTDLRAVPFPGQVPLARRLFHTARGLLDAALESKLVSDLVGQTVRSAVEVFARLSPEQSIELIEESSVAVLDTLQISSNARTRIAAAVASGKFVLTPTSPVLIDGVQSFAWLEIDLRTGELRDVDETGGHQVIGEYVTLIPLGAAVAPEVGYLLGVSGAVFHFLGNFLDQLNRGESFEGAVKFAKTVVADEMTKIAQKLGLGPWIKNVAVRCFAGDLDVSEPVLGTLLKCGLDQAITIAFGLRTSLGSIPYIAAKIGVFMGMDMVYEWLKRTFPVDPPVFPFLSSDLGHEAASVPVGASPALEMEIAHDPLFSMVVGGAELMSVFKVRIANRGPSDERVVLSAEGSDPASILQPSVPSIDVPSGKVVEVGLCLDPGTELPAPGEDLAFQVHAAGADSSAFADGNLTVPPIRAVGVDVQPPLASSAGEDVPVRVRVVNSGNVALDAGLSASAELGVAIIGLASSISLTPGEIREVDAVLQLDPQLANGSMRRLTIEARPCVAGSDPGCDSQPSPASASILVTRRSAAASILETIGWEVAQSDLRDLATEVAALTAAIAELEQSPDDARICERIRRHLENVVLLISITPDLAVDLDPIERLLPLAGACDGAALLAAIPDAFQPTKAAAVARRAHRFDLDLAPRSVEIDPSAGDPVFTLRLENSGTEATTLDLKLDGALPDAITVSGLAAPVTLVAGEIREVPVTLLGIPQRSIVFALTIRGTAREATSVSVASTVHVAVRPALADVVRVDFEPAGLLPGDETQVTARILNSANTRRAMTARIELESGPGDPVDVPLQLEPSLEEIEIGPVTLSTQGLDRGVHRVLVRLLDVGGEPIRGRVGVGLLFVGMPILADATAAPALVPPGDATVRSQISVLNQVTFGSGPIVELSRSPWEMHDGNEVTPENPNGFVPFSCTPARHGDICEYAVSAIPTATDLGWRAAPNPETIGFSIRSRVCNAPVSCNRYGDFTYFQTFVAIPDDFILNTFTIGFSGMDDGSRVSICNSHFPLCEVVPGSYVFLGGSGTTDLAPLVERGEINRVVVTQVDDCCSSNNLQRATVLINGASLPFNAEHVSVDLTHRVSPASYLVDLQSVAPAAVSANSTAISWAADLPVDRPVPREFALTGLASDMLPGESRQVSNGSTITATIAPGAPSDPPLVLDVELPPLVIAAEHVIGVLPATMTGAPGSVVPYSVKLRNPLAEPIEYLLTTIGPRGYRFTLDEHVVVAPGQTVSLPMTITIPDTAEIEEQPFSVVATSGGFGDSATAMIVVAGAPPTPALARRGVAVEIVPDEDVETIRDENGNVLETRRMTRDTLSLGTEARFRVRVTNLGSAADGYRLEALLPPGVTGQLVDSLGQPVVTLTGVLPGTGGARELRLTLAGTEPLAPGPRSFSVTAVSTSAEDTRDEESATLNVSGYGVDVAITPPTAAAGSSFTVGVANLGSQADSFEVAISGAAGGEAQPAKRIVGPLDPGASTQFEVSTSTLGTLAPGALLLVARAVSQGDTSVVDVASATVVVPDRRSLIASCSPETQILGAPGEALFLVRIDNTGNAEEGLSARIARATGPVAAALEDFDGALGDAVPTFRLPPLAIGAVLLHVQLLEPGQGAVDVVIDGFVQPPLAPSTVTCTLRSNDVLPTPTLTPLPTPSSATTAQPTPTTGESDSFKCYRMRVKPGFPRLQPIDGVTVDDGFDTDVVQIVRELHLCNPAQIEAEMASRRQDSHLACYNLRRDPGQEDPLLPELSIEDRFGRHTVKFLEPPNQSTLCVPADAHLASVESSNPELANGLFRCRRARSTPRRLRPAPEVTIRDEFESKRMRVRSLREVCTTASISGAPPFGDPSWLACYDVYQVPGQKAFAPPGAIEVANEFAQQTVIIRNGQRRVCVPAERR